MARRHAPQSILFCRDKDQEREIWDGFRYGPRAAQRELRLRRGASRSATLDDAACRACWRNQPALFYAARLRRRPGMHA
ncbi:MAG: aminopeptidase P N-terminal domain-containing protein [Comamonadaceae bacterium]|nr:aminopeptidase P N-terminal domain-containing protein [Comamonadaceae bacterium]